MRKRTKPEDRGNGTERGQMLVLFVLMLSVLLGFVAMSVDVGLILHERTSLQKAADAAALAGAQELDDSPAAATAMAKKYASANGVDLTDPSYTFEATTPYQGDPGKIEVKVSRQVDFLFGRVLGLDFANVPARAVADQDSNSGTSDEYALFAMNDACSANDPLMISGSVNLVVGAVHSNSKIKINGSNNTFNGPMTHTCSFDDSGSNNSYNPPPEQEPKRDLAMNYTWSSFCFPGNPDLAIPIQTQDADLNSIPEAWLNDDPATDQLKDGIFCSTGDVVLSDQGVSGNVTFVAGDEIKLSGSDFIITGYDDVLAFSSASHDNAIDMNGSGGSWTGFIIAPDGRVKIQGSNDLSVSGSVLADRITVSGSNFSIDASGFPITWSGPGSVSLFE